MRVLVADDEPPIRELLAAYLGGRGHAVTLASDGESAIARIRHDPPDAVATDLKMPGADGLEVVRAAVARGVPAVLMTGYGTVETAVAAFHEGAADLLVKPFKLRDLHAALERAVAENQADRHRRWTEAGFALLCDAAHGEAAGIRSRLDALVAAAPPDRPEAAALVSAVEAALRRSAR